MKKTFFSFAAAMLLAATLSAATKDFRSGKVLAAEMTLKKPVFAFEEVLRYPRDVDKRMYAAVVVMLDKGRKLSIYDYTLEVVGNRFPCVAIRVDNDPVDMRMTDVGKPSPFSKYTLLFVVDATLIGRSGRERHRLIPAAAPASSATELDFELRGQRPLTPPGTIPQNGILTVKP